MGRKADHLLVPHLPLIDRLVRHLRHRHALRAEEADDLRSYIHLRLLENDCETLRSFEGRSSLETYLGVVVQRMFLDWRRRTWGDWRPTDVASRLGRVAIEVERLWVREAFPWDQVQTALAARFGEEATPERLEAIRDALGSYRRPKKVEADGLEQTPDPRTRAESALQEREAGEAMRRLIASVREAIAGLDPDDRLILRLHFKEQKSLRTIAEALGWDHRKVHRRVGQALFDLRQQLSERGCTRELLLVAMEAPDMPQEYVWDSDAPPPSSSMGAER